MTAPAKPDWFNSSFRLVETGEEFCFDDLSALAEGIDDRQQQIVVHAASARQVIAALIAGWRRSRPVWLRRDLVVGQGAEQGEDLSDPEGGFGIWLETSGTTGRPKRIRHSMARLTGRLRGTATGDACWLLSYDPASFAGLQVILTAMVSGARLVSEPGAGISRLAEIAATGQVTHISATPSFWRGFLMACPDPAPDLRSVTSGGEAIDQMLLDRLASQFPNARLRHIYAMTEAGALFSVSDGLAGFPAAWLQSGIDDVRLRLVDGVLQVQSPRAMARVDQGPGLTADGWIDTGDLVEITGERALFVGRRDGRVNVGGVKVSPEQAEQLILTVAGISDAVVRAVANPITGHILAADIVLAPSADKAEVQGAMRSALTGLPAAARPRIFRFVDRIELAASGKKARTGMQGEERV